MRPPPRRAVPQLPPDRGAVRAGERGARLFFCFNIFKSVLRILDLTLAPNNTCSLPLPAAVQNGTLLANLWMQRGQTYQKEE